MSAIRITRAAVATGLLFVSCVAAESSSHAKAPLATAGKGKLLVKVESLDTSGILTLRLGPPSRSHTLSTAGRAVAASIPPIRRFSSLT